jgi:hypothetical protein
MIITYVDIYGVFCLVRTLKVGEGTIRRWYTGEATPHVFMWNGILKNLEALDPYIEVD